MTSTPSHDNVMPHRVPPCGLPPKSPLVPRKRTAKQQWRYFGILSPEEEATIIHMREWTHFGPTCPLCMKGR